MVLRSATLSLLVVLSVTPIHRAFAQAASSNSGGILDGLLDALVILLVVVAALFLGRKLRDGAQRDGNLLAETMTSPEGMQKLRAQVKSARTIAIVLAVPAVLVTVVLLIKINNTSNWALRYDGYVWEQLGWWFIDVGLLWLLTLAAGGFWFVSSRNFGRVLLDRVATIRTRLIEIEKELETRADRPKADLRSERQLLESELRQLGA
ncbi:hypothetical protein [Tistlia consotensis]|nr:hypothetical protein [Tistlia consotensis]